MDITGLAAAAGIAALVAGIAALVLGRRSAHDPSHLAGLESRVRELEEATPTGAAAEPEIDLGRRTHALDVRDVETRRSTKGTTTDALTDADTELFSESYFRVAVDARIAAARRHLRPVAVVLLDVVGGLAKGLPHPTNPKAVAESITATVRDADTACRLGDGRFALVLEDTPENGAIWTVERLRRHLAENHPSQTVWAGVACYPAHAFDTEEILSQAEAALVSAREWRQDRIEVAEAR